MKTADGFFLKRKNMGRMRISEKALRSIEKRKQRRGSRHYRKRKNYLVK